jgi:hypothetical protein
MEAVRERDLRKSLKLLLKECEKVYRLLLISDASNFKEGPGITLAGMKTGEYRLVS